MTANITKVTTHDRLSPLTISSSGRIPEEDCLRLRHYAGAVRRLSLDPSVSGILCSVMAEISGEVPTPAVVGVGIAFPGGIAAAGVRGVELVGPRLERRRVRSGVESVPPDWGRDRILPPYRVQLALVRRTDGQVLLRVRAAGRDAEGEVIDFPIWEQRCDVGLLATTPEAVAGVFAPAGWCPGEAEYAELSHAASTDRYEERPCSFPFGSTKGTIRGLSLVLDRLPRGVQVVTISATPPEATALVG